MRVTYVALFHSHLSIIFHLSSLAKSTYHTTNIKPIEYKICEILDYEMFSGPYLLFFILNPLFITGYCIFIKK